MRLDKILTKLQFVVNKSQTGRRLTPEVYNVLLESASNIKYRNECDKLEAISAQKPEANVYESLISNSPLRRYRTVAELQETSAIGVASLPSNFYKELSLACVYKGFTRKVDFVTEKELEEIKTSLAMPSLELNPKALMLATQLQVLPYDVGKSPNFLQLRYQRRPLTPFFDYCYVNSTSVIAFMPAGSYIRLSNGVYTLFDANGNVLARNVQHPMVTGSAGVEPPIDPPIDSPSGVLYNSATVELDWEVDEIPSIVGIIALEMGINLDKDNVAAFGAAERNEQ